MARAFGCRRTCGPPRPSRNAVRGREGDLPHHCRSSIANVVATELDGLPCEIALLTRLDDIHGEAHALFRREDPRSTRRDFFQKTVLQQQTEVLESTSFSSSAATRKAATIGPMAFAIVRTCRIEQAEQQMLVLG